MKFQILAATVAFLLPFGYVRSESEPAVNPSKSENNFEKSKPVYLSGGAYQDKPQKQTIQIIDNQKTLDAILKDIGPDAKKNLKVDFTKNIILWISTQHSNSVSVESIIKDSKATTIRWASHGCQTGVREQITEETEIIKERPKNAWVMILLPPKTNSIQTQYGYTKEFEEPFFWKPAIKLSNSIVEK